MQEEALRRIGAPVPLDSIGKSSKKTVFNAVKYLARMKWRDLETRRNENTEALAPKGKTLHLYYFHSEPRLKTSCFPGRSPTACRRGSDQGSDQANDR